MTTVNVSRISGRTVQAAYLGAYTGAGALSIGTVDTDDAVTQYQQPVTIPLTNFTESITAVTLNGTTCPIQSQVVGTSVSVDFPGNLATGNYTLSVSSATESATKTISYTQTHQYTSPVGAVDSNSLFSSPTLITTGTYHRIVTGPTNGTLDAATAEASSLWGNDVADIYTPNEGFTGDDSVQIEVLFDDGTTDTIDATITVEADITAPTLSGASVPSAGNTIAVQMSEAMQVGAGGTGGWTISLGDATIDSAGVDGSDATLINLTPSRTLTTADTFTIGYTQPSDGFQDQATTPNDLATLSGQAVTNNSTQSPPDTVDPEVSSASVPAAGNVIAVQMDESVQVGAGGAGGWSISLSGVTISSAAVDGVDDTIINLTPSRTLTTADTFTIGYTQPGDGFQDQATTPNDLATFSGEAVTNNSTQAPPDVTDPEVSFVSATANGSYKAGDTLSLTVATNENVTVNTTGGTPSIPVTIGSTVRQFSYASGSGTQSLVFSYTIQAGDNDADGIAVGSSIVANGATLKDAAGNALVLTLNSVADTSGILVDTVKPVITPDGNNPYTLVEGGTYSDPGATAVDDQDGTIGTVTGTHSVDGNTPGEYTVTYSGTGVTDTAGNEADDATRTVVVVAASASTGGRRAFMRSCVRSIVKSSVGDFKA